MQYKIHNLLFILNVFVAQAYLILIPIIALDVFNDKKFVATIGIIETVGGLIFGLLAIFLIDKIKNRKTLIFSSLILILVIIGQMFHLHEHKIYFIFSLIIFIVISRIIENVQNALMFAEYHKKGESGLEFFNSLTSSTYIIVGIVVAPLSVLIYKTFGITFLMIVSLPIVLLSFLIKLKPTPREQSNNMGGEFKHRLNTFFSNKKISTPIFLINGVMFSAMMVSTIYFLYVTQDLHYSNFKYTLLLALQSVGSVIVSMYVYSKFLKQKPYLISGFILGFGIIYFLFGVANTYFIQLAFLSFLLGACFTSLLMMLNERYQKNCPKEIYGTVNSIRITLNNVAGLLGAGVGSLLYISYGSVLVTTMTFILLTIVSAISFKFRKELEANDIKKSDFRKVSGSN